MGCGAACAAFAANISYGTAVATLGSKKAATDGFRLKELADFLKQCGLQYKSSHYNRVLRSTLYTNGSIVFIARSKKYPFGHYLIRHDHMWMDPWVNMIADKNLQHAKSGYRYRLPGKAQWVLYRQKQPMQSQEPHVDV